MDNNVTHDHAMRAQSWKVQLGVVLNARWKVKRRTKGAIFMDLILPLYMLAVFIMITVALENKSFPLSENYPTIHIPTSFSDLTRAQQFEGPLDGTKVGFAPANPSCCANPLS